MSRDLKALGKLMTEVKTALLRMLSGVPNLIMKRDPSVSNLHWALNDRTEKACEASSANCPYSIA
jgi:hypothetical protein